MPVEMKLSRIVVNEINDQQLIFLKEVGGARQFPILIGPFEAKSIEMRVKKQVPQRPQTHDLLVNSIKLLGGELDSVVITELREHTYYARLRVRKNGEMIEIDSRPSDAIAVAVTRNPPLPIFVAEEVIDEVLNS